jgi:putative tricarboxylic transport membrane protein
MRKVFRDGDVISGGLLAALGVFILMQSRAWDYYGPDGPGPGFFPFWYGVAMIALSLVLIASAAMNPQDLGRIDWPATRRALATWLAFVLAIALMDWLGFVVSFALLTFVIVAYVFHRPLRTAGITAVCAALGFYLTFAVALNVSLPAGLLGF